MVKVQLLMDVISPETEEILACRGDVVTMGIMAAWCRNYGFDAIRFAYIV